MEKDLTEMSSKEVNRYLKACPNCGGKARIRRKYGLNWVECSECHIATMKVADISWEKDGRYEALKLWNEQTTEEVDVLGFISSLESGDPVKKKRKKKVKHRDPKRFFI